MKTKFSIFAFSLLSILAPVKPMVLIAIAFIWLDLCFGVWRSVRLKGWRSIRSRGLARTVSKSLLYAGGIVAVYCLEKFVISDLIGLFVSVELVLTKAFTFFCAFIEIKSINESYYDVTGKDVLKSFKEFLTAKKQQWDEFKN